MSSLIKTMFILPPDPEGYSNICPPIGLCYLSANLKKHGFLSKVYDFSSFNLSQIGDILKREKPDVVGISCITISRESSYQCAKYVKKILPNAIIVFGGQHASFFPKHMFYLAPVDYVVMFEGDHSIVELIDAISTGKSVENIDGIAYRLGHTIKINSKRCLEKNIDVFPFPDYSNMNFNNYVFGNIRGNFIPIMSSRGCPYGCGFCSSSQFWGRSFRARSTENVIKEIAYFVDKYNTKNFVFYDDNFIIDKSRLIKICKEIIDNNWNIRFTVASSIRIIDAERLEWLKKAGCVGIGFGVESCSNKILANILKPQTKEDIERAFELARSYGLNPGGSLIVGSPGETVKTIKETGLFMKKINPRVLSYGGIMWILPGTPIYDYAKKKGFIDDNFWLKNHKPVYFTLEHSFFTLKLYQILLLFYQVDNFSIRLWLNFFIDSIFILIPERIKMIFRKLYYRVIRLYF